MMKAELLTARMRKIEELRPAILEGGDRAQQMRRLPDDLVDKLIDAGFFRFTLPTELGGEDATATETIEILEAIAAIDASTAWNVMLGSEINAMAAGGMEKNLAREIYLDNPRVVMCGGGGPGSIPSRAERQADGGFKVWGQSTFISGCHNASWCFMAAPVMTNGEMEKLPTGLPNVRMFFMPRAEWQIVDTWDVAGLRGSGSNDVRADGAYVAPKYAGVDLMSLPAHYANPVYRMPVPLRLSYNKVAVALGVAKGALEAFIDLAQNKIPLMSASTLKDRPIAQFRTAEANADYRAVRAYVMETMGAIQDELAAGRELPSPGATQAARLACTHGANVCMRVVDLLHNTAGTTGMRMYSPLERKLRDAHGCATHRWVSHQLYQDLGAILLGHPASPEFEGQSAR
jgi:alkylation response protein AidB-like acyl-CoA dehydrogenase